MPAIRIQRMKSRTSGLQLLFVILGAVTGTVTSDFYGSFGSFGSFATTAAPTHATTVAPMPSAAVRAASTTALTTDMTFYGMSADTFASKKTEVTAAIAYVLEVHHTMLEVTVKGVNRRLAASDSVILEVKVFVTPEDAAAMETKITNVKDDTTLLTNTVSTALAVTVTASVALPTEMEDQTPPAAPTTAAPESKELKAEKKSNAGAAIGGAIGGIAGLALLYLLYIKRFHKSSEADAKSAAYAGPAGGQVTEEVLMQQVEV
jgi:hypothetical protein